MPKMLFRGALIRFVDLRYDDKSKSRYARIEFTADYSEPVREAMEWGQAPDGFQSAKLAGEIVATRFTLTPNGKQLKQHELQLSAKQMSDFQLFRVKDEDDAEHIELRFRIVSQDPDAIKVWDYLGVIGKGDGQLRVDFEAQSEMDLADDSAGEVEAGRLISPEQAADTAEEDEEAEEGAPLAPAAVMGGTHQRGGRRQKTRTLDPVPIQ